MLAFLFAGQGSQAVGMGVSLRESCRECRLVFEQADEVLDYDLSRVMASGPDAELRRTEVAQPALLTLAVAQARHLVSLGVHPDALAGHSLGQYAALVVAGAIDFASAVSLVAARGALMRQTVPDGEGEMVAIVGLDREIVYAACQAARPAGVVDVACHNAPGQTVISGARAAVTAAAERCEEEGGGIVSLAVSTPFHCELLHPMVPAFAALVEAVAISPPVIPVIDNVTARPLSDVAAVRGSLIAQLTAPVLFEESLRHLADTGTNRFIQCGPGSHLLTLARRTVRGATLATFDDALASLPPLSATAEPGARA